MLNIQQKSWALMPKCCWNQIYLFVRLYSDALRPPRPQHYLSPERTSTTLAAFICCICFSGGSSCSLFSANSSFLTNATILIRFQKPCHTTSGSGRPFRAAGAVHLGLGQLSFNAVKFFSARAAAELIVNGLKGDDP